MKCVNCGFENDNKNKICLSCGKKVSKKNPIKVLLLSLLILVVIFIVIVIVKVVFICLGIYSTGVGLSNWIDSKAQQEKEENNMYKEIANELINNEDSLSNLKYVGYKKNIGWSSDNSKWFIYINEDDYDKYKYYWLEDVDEADKKEGYNSRLADYGDYVFTGINILDLNYKVDGYFENVYLYANQDYYLVHVYDKVLYYKKMTDYDTAYSIVRYDGDSFFKSYIFHKEGNKWIIDLVTTD